MKYADVSNGYMMEKIYSRNFEFEYFLIKKNNGKAFINLKSNQNIFLLKKRNCSFIYLFKLQKTF